MAIMTKVEMTNIEGVEYNTLEFNNINFGSLGYVVQTPPQYEYAEHEVEKTRIPGRNGEHMHFTGAYLNTTRQYSLVKKLSANNDYRDHSEYVHEANSLIQQLKSIFGYKILQDSFEPDYYRKAAFIEGNVVTNGNDQVIAIVLTFELMPQRWLVDGDTKYQKANPQPTSETFEQDKYYKLVEDEYVLATEYEANVTYYEDISETELIINKTQFYALPKITINKQTGQDTTTLTINNEPIVINWLKASNVGSIIIDSEEQDCYDNQDNNLNALVGFIDEFPKLKPGNNTIKIQNGTIEELIPRWWTI